MSTSDKICKDGASKSEDDGVCEVKDMQNYMSVGENNDTPICANCSKEGSDITNICNKCKMVKYCNAACKKKHRSKHKKECEEHIRLASEHAAELHDKDLFKQPPKDEDCPICFLRIPSLETGAKYMSCCGKVVCSGCSYAPIFDDQGNMCDIDKQNECPFCRAMAPETDEEIIERIKKRVEAGDAEAIYNLGNYYSAGMYGLRKNHAKALELWHQAGELGYTTAFTSVGCAYNSGEGVEVDKKQAKYYCELSAIGGNVNARYNLGLEEEESGRMERALKHHVIAAGSGDSDSLNYIKDFYSNGHATKEDYTKALQSYQAYLGEIKSAQRDEAAAACEDYRYY